MKQASVLTPNGYASKVVMVLVTTHVLPFGKLIATEIVSCQQWLIKPPNFKVCGCLGNGIVHLTGMELCW